VLSWEKDSWKTSREVRTNRTSFFTVQNFEPRKYPAIYSSAVTLITVFVSKILFSSFFRLLNG
jgi:hypothetical protein